MRFTDARLDALIARQLANPPTVEERARYFDAQLTLQGIRHDANETFAFSRQLEEIDQRLREIQYPVGHAVDIIPVYTGIDKGALQYTYRSVGRTGVAKRVSNWATDFPNVGLQGTETQNRLFNYGSSFSYNLQQLWSAEFANIGLERYLTNAVQAAQAEALDANLWFGDSEVNVKGLANAANVDIVAVVTGDWTTAQPSQMLEDMNALVRYIPTQTNGVERPDTLVLPSDSYEIVANTFWATTMPVTVLDMFKKAHPEIAVLQSYKLNTADAGGTGPRAIAFNAGGQKLAGLVPVEFMMLPMFEAGGEFVVKCLTRCGGVAVEYPNSVAFMDNIGA